MLRRLKPVPPTIENNTRSLRALLTWRKSSIAVLRTKKEFGFDVREDRLLVERQTAAARAYVEALRAKEPITFISFRE